jgi:hypothetical protein
MVFNLVMVSLLAFVPLIIIVAHNEKLPRALAL